jgi:hypothetical protein
MDLKKKKKTCIDFGILVHTSNDDIYALANKKKRYNTFKNNIDAFIRNCLKKKLEKVHFKQPSYILDTSNYIFQTLIIKQHLTSLPEKPREC